MKKPFLKKIGSVLTTLMLFVLMLPGSILAQNYCNSRGVNSSFRKLWIEKFDLGTISNTSGNNNGYANFTTQSATVAAGGTLSYTIVTDRVLLKNLFFTRIFADLNNDNDFNDSGETLVQDTSYVSLSGSFTIPSNTAAGNVRLRVTVKRLGYAPDCGAYFLGETEDYTLNVTSNVCPADAGTISANFTSACVKGGSTTIAATPNGNAVVPQGFQTIYVLTKGAGLVIEQVNSLPSFTVSAGGIYTIHTLVYDPSTLNLGIVVPGTTTGFDVNALLIQGGGTICASLDVAGAPVIVNDPDAGTLTAVNATICGTGGTLTATPDSNINVPAGYSVIYVLTSGTGLVIEQVNATPSFTVTTGGLYTIHTLVYDSTLDLSIVVPGTTTGFDVNGLLVQGGGSICASLDVAGAQFNVTNPDAGTLTAVNATICGTGGTLTATPDGNINVPAGYSVIYVLTSGTGLVIEQVNATPSFTVTSGGLYTIHTLVYDSTLDLSIVVPGTTTGFDVNGLLVQGGGSICASLDVAGAQFNVASPDAGDINPDQFLNCLDNGSATLTGNPQGNINVPAGYQVIYVLTRGQGLVIQQAGPNPQFTVTQTGLYRIHTLVYDPATLNLSIVVPGVTTGFDVNGLLVQGGGSICASLDVQGASFLVFGSFICNLFGINNSIIDLPMSESEMTEESIRLAENSMEGGILISNVYPNPASAEVNLQYVTSENGISTISIMNMMGQTIINERFEDIAGISLRTINTSALESGNYLIRIENNGKIQSAGINIVR